MERGHCIAGLACIIILILVVQGSAAGSIDRAVVKTGDSTYRITLQFPEGTVTGVTETVSGGMDIQEVSLPDEQYQIDGTTLFLAVIGDSNVSYIVTTMPGEPGEISGTCQDMLTGVKGTIPGARISGSGNVEILSGTPAGTAPAKDARPTATPIEPGLLFIALCAGGLLYLWRRGER